MSGCDFRRSAIVDLIAELQCTFLSKIQKIAGRQGADPVVC
ncbi:MAG: hypothetical protein ACLVBP_09795 [Ruminococcus sp.]